MKKLICLILTVLMAAAGISCFAEGTDNKEVTFVQIRDNTTAEVYENPGDTEAADTLEGGSLCVLIAETEAAGTAWYNVFYLNSWKEGAIGYIKADDAEKLSREQLGELMKDPDRINKLLDLVDALNDYTDADEEAVTQKKPNNQGGNESSESGLQELYEKAMDELAKIFNTDVAGELEKISDVTKEAAEFAQEVGQELLDAAAEGAADLLEKAGDALGKAAEEWEGKLEKTGEDLKKELEEKLPEEDKDLESLIEGISDLVDSLQNGTAQEELDKLLDKVSDGVDTLQKNAEEKYAEIEKTVQEKLEVLDKNFGKDTGNTLGQISEMVVKAQELLDNGIIQNGLTAIGEKFKEDGFTEGVNTVSTIIQLFSNMQ